LRENTSVYRYDIHQNVKIKVMTKKKPVADNLPDLAEPFFDEASTTIAREVFGATLPDVVKELPVLKYIKTASDIYSTYRLQKIHRRLKAFLSALIAGNFTLDEFSKLSADDQKYVVDILVTELDSQSDDMQSEAMGYLFNAYIAGSIDRLMFMGIAHELKNANPLVFYFNVDSYNLTPRNTGTTIDSGPVHYLPASFVANGTDKLAFSSELYLTNLGQAFFDNVYNPMSQKHMI
jgi:hypothetical protein